MLKFPKRHQRAKTRLIIGTGAIVNDEDGFVTSRRARNVNIHLTRVNPTSEQILNYIKKNYS